MTAPLTRWLIALSIAALAMGLLLAHAASAEAIAGVRHGALNAPTGEASAGQAVQALDGRWQGAVTSPGGGTLRVVLRISPGPHGPVAVLDLPDQRAYGVRIGALAVDDGVLTFTAASVEGAYSGVIGPDGKTISGEWTQRGDTRTLNLQRAGPPKAAAAGSPPGSGA